MNRICMSDPGRRQRCSGVSLSVALVKILAAILCVTSVAAEPDSAGMPAFRTTVVGVRR